MYLYVASPSRKAPVTEEHPLFRFDVASMVCTTDPIKLVVLGDNRYTSLMHLDMDDDALDALIEKATEARVKRRAQKAATLTALAESTYDDGAISMETAEKLAYLGNSILADEENLDLVLTDADLEDVSDE